MTSGAKKYKNPNAKGRKYWEDKLSKNSKEN
jgi:hypothetical protein